MAVLEEVNFFIFQHSHEALGLRIVIRVAAPRHTDSDPLLFE